MVEFLTVVNDQGAERRINSLFVRFQEISKNSVDAHFYDWDSIWRALVNMGIYRRGADVAEVGTTWLESLVAMNALRPFSPAEVDMLGSQEAFIPETWGATSIHGDARVWGIPARCDVRVVWYWKDMLEQAKVDAATGFADLQSLQETLEKLKAVLAMPWVMTIARDDPNIIQTLATWIWACKGEFVTPDCKKVSLLEPNALKALQAYFGLYQYMSKDTLDLSSNEIAELFFERKTAAIFGGPWVLTELRQRRILGNQLARIGIAPTPGPPFVGGTVLTIPRHVRNIQPSMEFIKFMMMPEIQVAYCPPVGLLPTTHKAWESPIMQEDPFNRVIYQAFENGRGLPTVALWGMVEEKLKSSIYQIWKDLLWNPGTTIDQAIQTHLEPTVRRLNISLQ